mmetsp:Transcript_4491/g.9050  ORF Transcript_4491/g.9050 Transcript_4491/m.9050 type:complete len:277 (+) Transcript_4491:169-999(+)
MTSVPHTDADLQSLYTQTAPLHLTRRSLRNEEYTSRQKGDVADTGRSEPILPPPPSFKEKVKANLPILSWFPHYDRSKSLRVDIIAGMVISFMVIPQGMAYGMLAGMPVEYGLYSSLFPPLIYMFFGTASHLSLGTNAPISILVADSVTAAIPTDTDCSDDVTSADCERILNATLVLCILSGIFYFVFWVFRFSMIVSFVPDPVLAGFTTGASVIIITSNMKHALGITTKRGQLWEIWGDIFSKLDEINWAAFAFFVLSYATIMGLKEVNKNTKIS